MFDILTAIVIIATLIIIFILFWTLVASSAPDKMQLKTIYKIKIVLDVSFVIDALALIAILILHCSVT